MSSEILKPYSGAFIGHTHHFALRVYIEDTDLGGVVYHANYLRYYERARSDLLRALEINQRASIESGQGVYAVAEIQVKYCRPAKFEDDLVVMTNVDYLGGATAVVLQKIVRGTEKISEARVTLAFISLEGRPKRQPPEWVQKFKELVKKQ